MSKEILKTYALRIQADLAKLRLDSLGVNSDVIATDTAFSGAIGGFKLLVDSHQFEQTNSYLESYESGLENNSSDEDFDENQ